MTTHQEPTEKTIDQLRVMALDAANRLAAENESLRQENERLREGLAEMLRCFGGLDRSKMYAAANEQARQLLQGTP